MQEMNLKAFKKKALINRRGMKLFMNKVEKNPPKNLKQMTNEIHNEVFAEIDCLTCGNCCKTMTPTFTTKDISRISKHLGMSEAVFKKKYLYFDKKDRDWMNVKQPCQFLNLEDNKCSIYEVRPHDCASFPHINIKDWVDYVHVHKQNIEYCPATFRMVEKMQERLNPAR
jgi:uncharacterized protein